MSDRVMLKRHNIRTRARRSSPDLTSCPYLPLQPGAALCFLWPLQVCRGSGVKTAAEAPLLSISAPFMEAFTHDCTVNVFVCSLILAHSPHSCIFSPERLSVHACVHVCEDLCTTWHVCVCLCMSLSRGVYVHMSMCAHLHVRVSVRACVRMAVVWRAG